MKKVSVPTLLLSILLFVLMMSLAACGSDQTTSSGANATATPTTAANKNVQKCGTISKSPMGNPVKTEHPDQVGNCFWQAFQQCQPASLVFSTSGVDTITTHTFTITHENDKCGVTDTVQMRIVPSPPRNVKTYTCGPVTNSGGVLRFSNCGGDGTINVPITKS